MTSFIPFGIFVASAIGLSFFGAVDINLLIGVGILAIVSGALLASDSDGYWQTIFDFMGSRTAMTATLLWLIVGVYGNILKEGHLVEGLVWAASQLDIEPVAFTLVVFLFSGIFAISTGSGFGTISAMSLTLYPAGVLLGASPALLGGAILSGAALGDSIAPVSDTAVIAATTQEDESDGNVADIGGTIRNRFPLVLIAVLVAVAAFVIAGHFSSGTAAVATTSVDAHPAGLALLIPTLIVIILSLRRLNIFLSLAVGIVTAVIIGLSLGLFHLADLVHFNGTSCSGAVVDGVTGMTSICVLLMVVVSLSGIVIRGGYMEAVVRRLSTTVVRSKSGAELTIFVIVSLAGVLIAIVNTIANICIAPFVNSVGKQYGIHPYRRSTILATVICTFPFIVPYGGCVLLLLKGVETAGCNGSLQATDVLLTTFYPWALFFVMLVACITGFRRNANERTH